MQTKTTISYHLTPVRMSILKKTIDNKCWLGCRGKGTLVHCWWGCKFPTTMENMEVPQKIKNSHFRKQFDSFDSSKNVKLP